MQNSGVRSAAIGLGIEVGLNLVLDGGMNEGETSNNLPLYQYKYSIISLNASWAAKLFPR